MHIYFHLYGILVLLHTQDKYPMGVQTRIMQLKMMLIKMLLLMTMTIMTMTMMTVMTTMMTMTMMTVMTTMMTMTIKMMMTVMTRTAEINGHFFLFNNFHIRHKPFFYRFQISFLLSDPNFH